MIKISVSNDGFVVHGHAGFARRGEDVVCASVSSIVQTAVLGLRNVMGMQVQIEKRDGYLKVDAKELDKNIIISTMVEGLKDLAKQFPNHIMLED